MSSTDDAAVPAVKPSTPNEAYFARLTMNRYKSEYIKRVAEIAEQNPESFEISLSLENGTWEKKTFVRQRVTAAQHMKIEKLRGQYDAETDLDKKADALALLYKELALAYLHMSEQDFEKVDWHEIKPALDSINFRFTYSFPHIVSQNAIGQQERKLLNRTIGKRP